MGVRGGRDIVHALSKLFQWLINFNITAYLLLLYTAGLLFIFHKKEYTISN